jgi:carbon-monoxide dehydrogenase small subunit
VLVDGEPTRACLMFAVQADGSNVRTIEGLAPDADTLHPVQQAFHEQHAMQCGFCTPGFVLSTVALLEEKPDADDDELLDALSGNLCRCTGYRNIIAAARQARTTMRPTRADDAAPGAASASTTAGSGSSTTSISSSASSAT